MKYTAPKGVYDILPVPEEKSSWSASSYWEYLESLLRSCAYDYAYKEIRTPIFEHTDLFIRSVGEGSDIVSKEMYTFRDKAERSLSLRPEGTAPVIRAYVEHNLHIQSERCKLFYIGPMFRYERQQAGRYRQHHQFGAEAIGCQAPEQDVEIIDFALEIYRRLGLGDLKVLLNTVGNNKTRIAYKEALTAFLTPKKNQLSQDSQLRFEKNILRILDSKDPNDQGLLEECPNLFDFLDTEGIFHFDAVQKQLKTLNVPFEICPKLVRGLDYYNHTVFEITTTSLGAHNTLCGGGRYDGLIESFGGPKKSSVGFATGLERVLQTLQAQHKLPTLTKAPFVYLIALGEDAKAFSFKLLSELRHAHIPSEMQLTPKKLGVALSLAADIKASYALIIGEEELAIKKGKLKNLNTREEQALPLEEVLAHLFKLYSV